MPGQEEIVHDGQGLVAIGHRLVEVGLEPVSVAVDDALLEPALHRPVEVLVGSDAVAEAPS